MSAALQRLKLWILRRFQTNSMVLFCLIMRHGFLFESGWFESWKKKTSIDRSGRPIPWITYGALSFLSRRLRQEFTVFEYGSGHSTLWWANRVQFVRSCEHDQQWYDEIKKLVPSNAIIDFRTLENGYANQVAQTGERYDLIVVDGRDRINCIKSSVLALKDDGVLILDNSERAEYVEAILFLRSLGFNELEFDGPGPIVFHTWRTSIFYHAGKNVLGI